MEDNRETIQPASKPAGDIDDLIFSDLDYAISER